MSPVGRYLGERAHHEAAEMGPRMGKGEGGFGQDETPMGDQVEIERARPVGVRPLAPERGFQFQQRGHDPPGIQVRLDKDDSVEIFRRRTIRPRRRTPPARGGGDLQAGCRQGRQGGFQEGASRPMVTVQV